MNIKCIDKVYITARPTTWRIVFEILFKNSGLTTLEVIVAQRKPADRRPFRLVPQLCKACASVMGALAVISAQMNERHGRKSASWVVVLWLLLLLRPHHYIIINYYYLLLLL